MPKEISQKIRELRLKSNLSQHRFGKKIGLTSKTISAYENGRIKPPYKVLEAIAQNYNVNLLELPLKKQDLIKQKLAHLEQVVGEIKDYLLEY